MAANGAQDRLKPCLSCSSRPGGWPVNLQGIWNGDYAPAWNSDVHTDENIQMNYWQALPGGLEAATLPLFDYFEKYLDDFRANARNIFNCRGCFSGCPGTPRPSPSIPGQRWLRPLR
jgi:alpha-L-fucosidase 2